MRLRFELALITLAAAALVGGCSCSGGGKHGNDGGTGGGTGGGSGGAWTTLPPDLAAQLPKDPDGRPILLSVPAGPDASIALAYDDTIDTPVTRWQTCVSLADMCYGKAATSLSSCLHAIKACPDDTGGKDCCPPGCIAAYDHNKSAGMSDDDAIDHSIVHGDCLTGFAAYRDDAGVEGMP